jgi:ribosome modulation factor
MWTVRRHAAQDGFKTGLCGRSTLHKPGVNPADQLHTCDAERWLVGWACFARVLVVINMYLMGRLSRNGSARKAKPLRVVFVA